MVVWYLENEVVHERGSEEVRMVISNILRIYLFLKTERT